MPNQIETITELVTYIYSQSSFRNWSNSLTNNKYTNEEIYQEFLLNVCERPDKMINLYNEGNFDRYACTMIRNLKYYKYSKINKHFDNNKIHSESNEILESTEDISYEKPIELHNKTDHLLEDINIFMNEEISWYDKELFNMYFIQKLTYRKISEITKIPHTSIFYTIKNLRENIIKKFKLDYKEIKDLW